MRPVTRAMCAIFAVGCASIPVIWPEGWLPMAGGIAAAFLAAAVIAR